MYCFRLSTVCSFLIPFLLLITSVNSHLSAQSKETDSEHGAHKISLGIGHVYYGKQHADIKDFVVDAYVFNYDYIINSHWSIGSHNDIIIEDIRTHIAADHKTITEHKRPIITKAVGSYSPIKHAHLMFGIGDEISHLHNSLILNLGVDYGVTISHGWEIGAEINFDNKLKGADSWVLGIGLSKIISKHL